MCYRPARPLLLAAAAIALVAAGVGLSPVEYWVRHGSLHEWMIYRILLASLLATIVIVLVCAAVLADRVSALALDRAPRTTGATGYAARLFTSRMRRALGAVLVASAVVLVWPGIAEYALTRTVTMHWSRAVLASLLVMAAVTLGTTVFLLHMTGLIRERRAPLSPTWQPDRVYKAAQPIR